MRVEQRDRGQAILLVIAVLALIAVCGAALAQFDNRLLINEQAQIAADAAALAGAVGGREAAERLAVANQGVLIEFAEEGEDVRVVVRVGAAHATARATRAP